MRRMRLSARRAEWAYSPPNRALDSHTRGTKVAKLGEKMRKSEHRLLTTHAGSLPRPAELTRLYARQSRGEAVLAAELEAEGKAALRRVVAKQIEVGIDVANNGEQQRDSFVLYVRDRLSGRLERLAAVVGDPRRIIAGTDCGFETIAGRGRIAEDVVWAKLKALSEGARLASSRVF